MISFNEIIPHEYWSNPTKTFIPFKIEANKPYGQSIIFIKHFLTHKNKKSLTLSKFCQEPNSLFCDICGKVFKPGSEGFVKIISIIPWGLPTNYAPSSVGESKLICSNSCKQIYKLQE